MCTSPRTYSNLAFGSHHFEVRAVDKAGNFDWSAAGFVWIIRAPTPTPTPTPYPTPATGCAQPLLRVDVGSWQPVVDHLGNTWLPDQPYKPVTATWGFVGGFTYATHANIAGTSDPALYQSERWWPAGSPAGYRFEAPSGDYQVTFHFAEIYPWVNTRSRVFGIMIEGQRQISDLDVYALAGLNKAYVIATSIHVSDGVLTVDFLPQIGSVALNALEIASIVPCTGSPTAAAPPAARSW